MSDANKNPEVEIDLDDVKETDVKVEETKQEESKQPDLNAGEVDLGYTEHDKEQPKENVAVEEVQEEPTQETKQQSDPEDLSEVIEGVPFCLSFSFSKATVFVTFVIRSLSLSTSPSK